MWKLKNQQCTCSDINLVTNLLTIKVIAWWHLHVHVATLYIVCLYNYNCIIVHDSKKKKTAEHTIGRGI